MSFHFDTLKAVQAASVLLKESPRRILNYTNAIKTLYMADRKSLEETGSPITGDSPVAMDKGPVLSCVLDLIKNTDFGAEEARALWRRYIRTAGYDIELILDPGDDKLSDFEVDTLKAMFAVYGTMDLARLITEMHKLPEWGETYVEGTSTYIHLKSRLDALGMSELYDELSKRQIEDAHFANIFGT